MKNLKERLKRIEDAMNGGDITFQVLIGKECKSDAELCSEALERGETETEIIEIRAGGGETRKYLYDVVRKKWEKL